MIRDFSKIPDYSKRMMFLDPAGPVTTQRYDDYAYPKLAKFDEAERSVFWVPEEVNLQKDQVDFKYGSSAVRHMFTSNILRQTTLDSKQGRDPVQIFSPVSSIPELEALVTTWTWFEQIHSRAYSHIIRNIYNVPKTEFNKIHDNAEILGMISSIDKYYSDLHRLNCMKELQDEVVEIGPEGLGGSRWGKPYPQVSEHEHIKAIYMALIASFGLEAIRFTTSFVTSMAMVENKIFIGNGIEISLILFDEMLHCDWTAYILNTVVKDDPRFKEVAHEMQKEAYDALIDVVDEEKKWAKHLCKEGPVIGLNEKVLVTQADWTAQYRFKEIGMKYDAGVKSTPTPWFNKYLNTSKTQVALQEAESDSYVMSTMSNTINYDELPNFD